MCHCPNTRRDSVTLSLNVSLHYILLLMHLSLTSSSVNKLLFDQKSKTILKIYIYINISVLLSMLYNDVKAFSPHMDIIIPVMREKHDWTKMLFTLPEQSPRLILFLLVSLCICFTHIMQRYI